MDDFSLDDFLDWLNETKELGAATCFIDGRSESEDSWGSWMSALSFQTRANGSEQGALLVDLTLVGVDNLSLSGHDGVIGLWDNGDQEVEKHDQHVDDDDYPKEPGVTNHEIRHSVVFLSVDSVTPELVVRHCQVTDWVSEHLDGIDNICVYIGVILIVHIDSSNSVQETENDNPSNQEGKEGSSINEGLLHQLDQHTKRLVESEQEHHFREQSHQEECVNEEPKELFNRTRVLSSSRQHILFWIDHSENEIDVGEKDQYHISIVSECGEVLFVAEVFELDEFNYQKEWLGYTADQVA